MCKRKRNLKILYVFLWTIISSPTFTLIMHIWEHTGFVDYIDNDHMISGIVGFDFFFRNNKWMRILLNQLYSFLFIPKNRNECPFRQRFFLESMKSVVVKNNITVRYSTVPLTWWAITFKFTIFFILFLKNKFWKYSIYFWKLLKLHEVLFISTLFTGQNWEIENKNTVVRHKNDR